MFKPEFTPISKAIGLSALLVGASQAQAAEFETGNPDLIRRWDNTIRYNLGIRAESRDTALGNNATYDESNYKVDRGDVVTNRLDVMSEFELTYKQNHGLRISGAAWYDDAYSNTDVKTNPGNVYYPGATAGPSTPSYRDGSYSSHTERYHHGLSGELLGAFVFSCFHAGAVPASLLAGHHALYRCNGLLTAGRAESNAQDPFDVRKALANTGKETREIFLPLAQISGQAQV